MEEKNIAYEYVESLLLDRVLYNSYSPSGNLSQLLAKLDRSLLALSSCLLSDSTLQPKFNEVFLTNGAGSSLAIYIQHVKCRVFILIFTLIALDDVCIEQCIACTHNFCLFSQATLQNIGNWT